MSANSETPAPRLFGAVLCAAASLLTLVSALYLFAAGGGGRAALPLLIVGLGLGLAAIRTFGRR